MLLLAIARVSMVLALPTIGLIAWLGSAWLDEQFASVNRRVDGVEQTASSASTQAVKVNDRLIAVETKQVQESASSDRFQAATLNRLDRLQDSIVGLSNAVSALTATVQALAEERTRSPPK
ncbi:hypothetical protein [Pseudaminobacter sp. NGMCC 1.201702]|uniref:hypothetical protein n=1 Tax=Pseudaminobacter sp. NGMCC 1.201702 TaxID=3391825 RepID=UPI0039EF37A2